MKGPGILLLLAISFAYNQEGVNNFSISPGVVDSYKKVRGFANVGGKCRDVKVIKGIDEFTNAGKFIEGVYVTHINFAFQVMFGNLKRN